MPVQLHKYDRMALTGPFLVQHSENFFVRLSLRNFWLTIVVRETQTSAHCLIALTLSCAHHLRRACGHEHGQPVKGRDGCVCVDGCVIILWDGARSG